MEAIRYKEGFVLLEPVVKDLNLLSEKFGVKL
jgi:hypothetical protein